jgi:hypothetical protein
VCGWWVLGQQSGIDGAAAPLALLCCWRWRWAADAARRHPHRFATLATPLLAVSTTICQSRRRCPPRPAGGAHRPAGNLGTLPRDQAHPGKAFRGLHRGSPVIHSTTRNHAEQHRRWPTWTPKVVLLARRLDAARTRRHRRLSQLGRSGALGLCDLVPAAPRGKVRRAVGGRCAGRIGQTLTPSAGCVELSRELPFVTHESSSKPQTDSP